MQTGPSGPLAKFITGDIYVSGVRVEDLSLVNTEEAAPAGAAAEPGKSGAPGENGARNTGGASGAGSDTDKQGIFVRIGKGVGVFVGKFFQAGRDTIDMVIKHILPFMAFISVIIGIIRGTGLGDLIATGVTPLAGSLPGMLALSAICAIPFVSPVIGPGAVIAQVVGVLVGQQIAGGTIKPSMALPALFAIDAQVGADFVPVGLALGEAEPDTVTAGVPAVLFSRLITGPAAVLIAYFFSFGLY
jgi:PTS system glucitol/sorbitol-specific IIC component